MLTSQPKKNNRKTKTKTKRRRNEDDKTISILRSKQNFSHDIYHDVDTECKKKTTNGTAAKHHVREYATIPTGGGEPIERGKTN